jgi:hypothetical protein
MYGDVFRFVTILVMPEFEKLDNNRFVAMKGCICCYLHYVLHTYKLSKNGNNAVMPN